MALNVVSMTPMDRLTDGLMDNLSNQVVLVGLLAGVFCMRGIAINHDAQKNQLIVPDAPHRR